MEKTIVVLGIVAALCIGGYAVYVVTMFWVKFAQGINEANPPQRGFYVDSSIPTPPEQAESASLDTKVH